MMIREEDVRVERIEELLSDLIRILAKSHVKSSRNEDVLVSMRKILVNLDNRLENVECHIFPGVTANPSRSNSLQTQYLLLSNR
ncbi:hypothetical protein [Peribacillus alkalitolerans]|uniref:hypothetical protein n=1 Tax=Peribacillus alkalitolerans TaxID=1550385 RepID=UPI0013D6C3E9|nr:hypothetical protein [Peribacillus alkalitolerans]